MSQTSDPTPNELASLCAEIQAGWSPDEKLKRLRADLRPTYQRCDGIRETMSSDGYDRHHARIGCEP